MEELSSELKQQMATREALEGLAQGSGLSDTIFVPIMEQHNYNVDACAQALLEIMSPTQQQQEAQERDFELEKEQLREFERLRDEKAKKAAAEEQQQFLDNRKKLETEWNAKLKAQEQRLAQQRAEMEAQKQAEVEKALANMAQKDAKFRAEVEAAMLRQKAEFEERQREAETRQAAELASVVASTTNKSGDEVIIKVTAVGRTKPGQLVTVYWEYTKGIPSKSDWVGLFKKSRPEHSNQYYVYQKTRGLVKGSLEFVVPSKLGICEFRFFQNNSYKIIARSEEFVVGNLVTVDIAKKTPKSVVATVTYLEDSYKSSWDWVAIFPAKSSEMVDNNYLWVKGKSLEFSTPTTPGIYEIRYFQSGSGTSELARSSTFEVDNTDVMSVTPSAVSVGDNVTVSWTIDSLSTFSQSDWIGLFSAEDAINPLLVLSRQESHCLKNTGQLKFKMSDRGKFVFGFFRANSGRLIKQTNEFLVQ